MTTKQKVNILKATRKSFETRLDELSQLDLPEDEVLREEIRSKKDSLARGIHFCNFLIVTLRANNDFKPENASLLEYIGLEDL